MISVNDIGGPTVVARMTGLSVPTVHGWKNIPSHHCPTIEMETLGRFSCESLRPDLVWWRVPDVDWPYFGGRPLLDLTQAVDKALAEKAVAHG